MPTPTSAVTPRIGARVLVLDPTNRILLIHALDPADPTHHWWELPGGGQDDGEDLHETACRELAEESGITLTDLGRELWVRESRFRYQGRDHHRIDHVFLGHTPTPPHTSRPTPPTTKSRPHRTPLVDSPRTTTLPRQTPPRHPAHRPPRRPADPNGNPRSRHSTPRSRENALTPAAAMCRLC